MKQENEVDLGKLQAFRKRLDDNAAEIRNLEAQKAERLAKLDKLSKALTAAIAGGILDAPSELVAQRDALEEEIAGLEIAIEERQADNDSICESKISEIRGIAEPAWREYATALKREYEVGLKAEDQLHKAVLPFIAAHEKKVAAKRKVAAILSAADGVQHGAGAKLWNSLQRRQQLPELPELSGMSSHPDSKAWGKLWHCIRAFTTPEQLANWR